jgi:hypothetical protein
MIHNAITKHIVTKGDFNMVPAGQRLYDCPNCQDGKRANVRKFYNVAPGQLVAFTISDSTLQPITVDSGNISSVTGDLYIGVGIDTDGDGAADDVRLLAGEKLDKCLLDETSVSAPVCGQPQILATYLDCQKCWENYTVHFKYSDNMTKSFGLTRADAQEFVASFSTECHTCDDCEPAVNQDEVICKMVDSLNGEFDNRINGERYPDKKAIHLPRDFRAVRLHSNWYTYCLDPISAACDCEGCNATDALVDARIDGNLVTFSGNLNPSDNSQTYLAQLENVAQQIECGFDEHIGPHAGFAFVTGGGPDKCCPFQLHIVTCDATFELHGASGEIDSCEGINPFPSIAEDITCVDCGGPAPTPFVGTNGIAVIINQPDLNCDVFVDKPLASYYRTGELTFIKNLDDYTPIVKATELMAPRFPENFGAEIKYLEYSQETGGRGRQYRDVNARQGWLGLPDAVSRARHGVSFSDCSKSYCTYYLGHSMKRRPVVDRNHLHRINRLSSFIHIPSDDSNTISDWETFYNALLTIGSTTCNILGPVSCLQVEGTPTYSPVNTGIPAASPAYTPSYEPTYTPTVYNPTYIPSYAPSYAPTYSTPSYTTPSYTPTYTPTYAPSYTPTYATPSYTPTYTPT